MHENQVRSVVASVRKLAQMDPQDEAVAATVQEMEQQISLLSEQSRDAQKGSVSQNSMKDDMEFIRDQITKLHSAAIVPAQRYQRILNICAGLKRAAMIAERPQYAAIRPRIAAIVTRVAGAFAQVDTVADLDKPLEAIEKAVSSLYSNGKQNDPSTYNFQARGKGHLKDAI